jgi:hypothetical protein
MEWLTTAEQVLSLLVGLLGVLSTTVSTFFAVKATIEKNKTKTIYEKWKIVMAMADEAMKVAESLYKGHMDSMKKLEEKKGTVANKLTTSISKLEKKRKEHMDMAKSDPKTAAEHKKHVSEISSKIEELMDKLSMVEKSKKPIETDDEKETLKENIESDIKSTLPGLDINVRQGKDSSVLTYGRGEPLSNKQIELLKTKYEVYEHEDESDDRGSSYYYTIKEKVSESINETLIGINPELVKKVKNFVNGIAKLYGYGTSDAIYNINAVIEFIKKQSIDETQDKSYKVDDIVVVNKGPHKGIKHKIIHVSGDGKYNIKPILPPGSKNKYRLGASSATANDFEN